MATPTPLPERDHRISLADAVRFTTTRRDADAKNPDRERAFAFLRAGGVDALLAQAGCVAFRAYPAQHDDASHTWVLVGVDDKGSDMTAGLLLQIPMICPPDCNPDSVLLGGK